MPDFIALLGIDEINRQPLEANSGRSEPRIRTAYLFTSLKRAEEEDTMRNVYGSGFFLVGVYTPEHERLMSLQTHRSRS